MKCIFFSLVVSIFCTNVYAQVNLVPNPSFEDTVGCPVVAGDIDKAAGWMTLCGSPDFYNVCDPNSFNMGVPYNWAGYQNPASGDGYAGFATYSNGAPNAREFPACTLTMPLSVGVKYFVSFKVSLALTSNVQANCASNNIGARFITQSLFCDSLIDNNPPVYADTIICDSMGWTQIFGSFISDSAFSHLVIGNFFDDNNTDTTHFFNDFSDNAYYFLDDVCVSTDSLFTMNYTYTDVQDERALFYFSIYPNPAQESVTIENHSYEDISLSIYNALGQEMISKDHFTDAEEHIDVSDYTPGLYTIMLRSESFLYSYQFIKQ